MKISVCRRGRSGKGVIVALLTNTMIKKDYRLLVVAERWFESLQLAEKVSS